MKAAIWLAAVVSVGIGASALMAQKEPVTARRNTIVAGRSKIATRYGIVAASQPLAARAGVQVLERGGNAIDAAIGANAVLSVVEPQMNGLGGDLFAIVSMAGDAALHGLNASGWAPQGLTPAYLKARGLSRMPSSGIHSVTVPGACRGWDALRARFGRLPLADDLAPAIFYADHGFPVSEIVARNWSAYADKLSAEPEAARLYLPGGRAPRTGEMFRNPDLPRSPRLIADDGPRALYEGPIAAAILSA